MSTKMECPLDLDEFDHMRIIFRNLDSMRQQKRNCDVTITVEGNEIYANKGILCAASDYFSAMFSHDTKENQSGIIEMKEVSFVAVKKCVDFIYTAKLSTREEECEDLMYAVNMLQLNNVSDKIQQFLAKRLNCNSFFIVKKVAEKFSIDDLTTHCDKFALDNIQTLAEQEMFKYLDLAYVSYLLSSSIVSADTKLSIGLKWINHAPEERDVHLMKVVSLIDMDKLSRTYCRQLAQSEPLCHRSGEFMTKIVIAITACDVSSTPNSLILIERDTRDTYIMNKKRMKKVPCSFSKGGKGFSTCLSGQDLYVVLWAATQVYVLNTNIWKWRRCPDMLHHHGRNLQCIAHEGNIYVGGNNRLQRFWILKNKWETIDLGPSFCNRSSLIVYKNRLFIIGGWLAGNSVKVVARYCLDSCEWTMSAPLCTARHNAASTVFSDAIYVAGGISDDNEIRSFEMHDNFMAVWTELPPMLSLRSRFRLVVVGNKLFAVGDGAGKCSIEVFDAEDERWCDYPTPMKNDIVDTATVSLSYQQSI